MSFNKAGCPYFERNNNGVCTRHWCNLNNYNDIDVECVSCLDGFIQADAGTHCVPRPLNKQGCNDHEAMVNGVCSHIFCDA